uniref:Uncharacterized protein n=1 Tax=Steinernema glaseri TaxID=37863 RepID=A0A1I7ZLA3_9BILA
MNEHKVQGDSPRRRSLRTTFRPVFPTLDGSINVFSILASERYLATVLNEDSTSTCLLEATWQPREPRKGLEL